MLATLWEDALNTRSEDAVQELQHGEGQCPVVLGGLVEVTDGSGLLSPSTWTQKGSICLQNVFPHLGK